MFMNELEKGKMIFPLHCYIVPCVAQNRSLHYVAVKENVSQ